MNLSERGWGEECAVYQRLAVRNLYRYYGFLYDIIVAAVATRHLSLDHSLIKALNFQAIVGLHEEAGEYRSVGVTVGGYRPPPPSEVGPLMTDLVDTINPFLKRRPSAVVAAFALWRLNYIHPFVNGNGRTARAICYYILCVTQGGLLPGREILPEILRKEPMHGRYVTALDQADGGDLKPLIALVRLALSIQINSSSDA